MSSGRPRGTAFELYGFDAFRANGRNFAICRICNKKLQNTAHKRLLGHRNACPIGGHHSKKENQEGVKLSQSFEPIKTECSVNFKNNINSEGSLQEFKQNNKTKDDEDTNSYDEQVKNIQDYVDDNSLSIFNKDSPLNNEFDDVEIEDEDTFLQKMKIGKQNKKRTMPSTETRSRKWIHLQEEKTKAETFFYRKKGTYFQKQTENLDIQRKLMILQSQKLRLEIEKIRNEL